MSNLLRNLLITLGITIVIFGAYMLFLQTADPDIVAVQDTSNVTFETQELLTRLTELQSVDVTGDVFEDPLFLSLLDFRQDLGDELSGRTNPFAPVE